MSADQQAKSNASGKFGATGDERELRVTVTLALPLENLLDSYRQAILPDGGYTGTVNAWIEEYAESIQTDMQRAATDAYTVDSSWGLA